MKIVCVYHSIDLDGYMSAAIVKHWAKSNYDKIRIYNNNDQTECLEYNTKSDPKDDVTLVFIGYNYGQPIPDLSEYDKVIMCDISFPVNVMFELGKEGNNFIWIDHHISAIRAVMGDENAEFNNDFMGARYLDTSKAACELTWEYLFPDETVPEIVRLLGLYDSFRHKGTNEEIKVLEFQYGARSVISNYEEAYNQLIQCTRVNESEYWRLQAQVVVGTIKEQGKSIYKYLCEDAKISYKNGFEVIFDNVGIFTKPKLKFIAINRERFNPINFGIDYHKDGYDGCMCFHMTAGKHIAISLYNDNGLVDCSIIAKQYGGGGHRSASCCRMTIDEFNNLIK